MAESGSPIKSSIPPSSSAAAAPLDWELLTISMSASALGKPHGDDLDNVSETSNPKVESSSNPSLKEGAGSSDAWTDPLHASVSRDPSNDVEAEPFIEGWKPHFSTSSGLYGYVAEENHQEEPPLPSEGAENYFDSKASMNMQECLLVSDKDDGDVKTRLLAYNHSVDDIKSNGEGAKERIKCKGRKRPKQSSTVVWSLAMAVSVVGIVFLGNRLRLAYDQNQQLQIHLSAKDEKLNEMLLQVKRLKEVLGNHHGVLVSRN